MMLIEIMFFFLLETRTAIETSIFDIMFIGFLAGLLLIAGYYFIKGLIKIYKKLIRGEI